MKAQHPSVRIARDAGAAPVSLPGGVLRDLTIERWPVDKLVPYARNARTHSPEQVAQVAASIIVKFKAFVVLGLPGETPETVEETRRWLIDNEVDDLTVTMFVPYPGSDVWEHPEEYPDIEFSRDYESAPMPFRGGAGLSLRRTTRTTALSAEELAALPEQIEADVRRQLGLSRLISGGGSEAVA